MWKAKRREVPILGLAVEVRNYGARRHYERPGYALWEHGLVIDRWARRDDQARLSKSITTTLFGHVPAASGVHAAIGWPHPGLRTGPPRVVASGGSGSGR